MPPFLERLSEILGAILEYPLVTMGGADLTVATLVTLLFLFACVVLIEIVLRRLFVMRVLRRTSLEPSLQYAIGRITGYLFLALGFYIAFQMVGVTLSSLAVIVGAIGVGIGFGLQNVINNFVSGLIILTERHIAVGDHIEVGGVDGNVEKISLRSTTVITNDNIAIIVPNADFIANTVTNWSHRDTKVRFRIPVGIAYGSDVEKFKRVMIEIANENPMALKEPKPDVLFVGFGDSSLNFEVAVWTKDMLHRPSKFRSELLYAIERKLREHKIEIPFPQRDLHLRSGFWQMAPPERRDG